MLLLAAVAMASDWAPPRDLTAGSGVERRALDAASAEELAKVVRLWGFLKFHHPDVQSGALEWDGPLLDAVVALQGGGSRAEVALAWRTLLPVRRCSKGCVKPEPNQVWGPDLSWFADWPELDTYLADIHRNRPSLEGARFGWADGELMLEKSEAVYRERAPRTDAGLRVLAVARHWTLVEYFQSSRHTTLRDWPQQLPTFLTWAFEETRTRDDYRRMIARMAHQIRDGHANVDGDFLSPRGACSLPLDVRFIEDRFVVFRSDLDGVVPGDVIVGLEEDLSKVYEGWADEYGGAHRRSRLSRLAERITFGPCGSVTLRTLRAGKPLDHAVVRSERERRIDLRSLEGERIQWFGEVAYVKLAGLQKEDVAGLMSEVAEADGLVFETRDYPGFVLQVLPYHLVSEPHQIYQAYYPDHGMPGAYYRHPYFSLDNLHDPLMPHFGGPVAVLGDEESWSLGEAMVVALKSVPRVRLFGQPTSGADGSMMTALLPGPFRVGVSTDMVVSVSGESFNPDGVAPDVTVAWRVDDVRSGRDPVVQAAVTWVRSQSR